MTSRKPRIRTISGTVKKGYEPTENFNPIPWPLFAVAMALIAWGAYTLFTASNYADKTPTEVVASSGNAENSQADSQEEQSHSRGEALFVTNCSSCHQVNGVGMRDAIPPLADSPYVAAEPAVLASIMIRGIEGPIEVKGRPYDGKMPTFGATLNDGEIAAITNYVHARWGDGGDSEQRLSAQAVATLKSRYGPAFEPWDGGAELHAAFPVGGAKNDGPDNGQPASSEEAAK